jgi:hypothetical protein
MTLPWFLCALLQCSTHIAPCPFSPRPMFSILNTPCQFFQNHKNRWLLKNAQKISNIVFPRKPNNTNYLVLHLDPYDNGFTIMVPMTIYFDMDVEPRAYTKTYQANMCDGRWSSVESCMETGLLDNQNITVFISASIATSLCCHML